MKRLKWWLGGLFGIALLVLILPLLTGGKPSLPEIQTAQVSHEELTDGITATGTLSAVNTVVVGTQVSGVVAEVMADYNQLVKKGQILAKLDTRNLESAVTESEAALEKAQVQMQISEKNYKRTQVLYQQGMVADLELETAYGEWLTAKASVSSATAMLKRNQVNLDFATITAPMNGVILDRNVEPGQTVAASFNTPTLFTMAADLGDMEIEADVDEADIGLIRAGMKTIFTVDAWPEKEFTGSVSEVRLLPVVSQNVVTYTVVISVPNPEGILYPGMTASLEILTSEVKDAVSVPTSAVNLSISDNQLDQIRNSGVKIETLESKTSWIWMITPGQLTQKEVLTGYTNGTRTVILLPVLGDSILVVSGVKEPEEKVATSGRSPFLPTPPSPNK